MELGEGQIPYWRSLENLTNRKDDNTMSFGFDDAPPPVIEDIRDILIDRCYQPWRANAIAVYCWHWKFSVGCPYFLSEEDRHDVQEILNEEYSSTWDDYNHVVWSISEEAR